MNHAQLVDLATAIQGLRPDWQQPGIIAQLKTLSNTWPGTTAAFYVHAITVAANPQANTPAAFNAITPAIQTPRRTLEPSCAICSQSFSECQRRHDHEIRRGIPDPHQFESRGAA